MHIRSVQHLERERTSGLGVTALHFCLCSIGRRRRKHPVVARLSPRVDLAVKVVRGGGVIALRPMDEARGAESGSLLPGGVQAVSGCKRLVCQRFGRGDVAQLDETVNDHAQHDDD